MDFYLIATPMYLVLLIIAFYSLKQSIKEEIKEETKVICKIEAKQYYRQHQKKQKLVEKISIWITFKYLLKNFTLFHLFTAKRRSRSQPLLFAYSLINIFIYYFIDLWPITLGIGTVVSLAIFVMQLTRNNNIQETISKSEYYKSNAKPEIHSIIVKFIIFWSIIGIINIGAFIYLIGFSYKNYQNLLMKKKLIYFGIGVILQNLAIKPIVFFVISLFGSHCEFLMRFVQKQNKRDIVINRVHIINDTEDININQQQNSQPKNNHQTVNKNYNIFQQVENDFNSHSKLRDDETDENYARDKHQQNKKDNYQQYIKRFDFSKIKQKTSKRARDKQLTFFINWLDNNQVIHTQNTSYKSSNNFKPNNQLETKKANSTTNYNSEPELRNKKIKIKEIFEQSNNGQQQKQKKTQFNFFSKEIPIQSKDIVSYQKISKIAKRRQPLNKTCFLKVEELQSQIKEVAQIQQQQSKREDQSILGKYNLNDNLRSKRKSRKAVVNSTDQFQKQKQNLIQIYLPTQQRYDFDAKLTGKYSCKSWGTSKLAKNLKKREWTKNRDKPIVHQAKGQIKQFYL